MDVGDVAVAIENKAEGGVYRGLSENVGGDAFFIATISIP